MPTQPALQQQQQQDEKRQAAREVIDILHEISTILNTHLDRTELSLCVSLIENGVNPEALAAVIKELRREAAAAMTASATVE
ncbi:mitotic-spindle organizing protein 1 [Emergomyces africanus]|uniref:Mitotic-spindle organizing protein 1 n=1 Tax=Emergomyces africanus TaxID=1955775 RepID=A0A1B7P7B1_9EURO|nr:mitotic-spindle organizing protein 1 [Emergomyces africanus]